MSKGIRFEAYRERLFAGIKKALEQDSHCKSYEGEVIVKVIYPFYFAKGIGTHYSMTTLCYVLGDSRSYEYAGKSLDDCLDLAEQDLSKWERELLEAQDD